MIIDRFQIRQAIDGGWSCPAKVMAIYAHDRDFDYRKVTENHEETKSIVHLDDCDTYQKVLQV